MLKAEIEEERLVQFDEGEGLEARQGLLRLPVCVLRGGCFVLLTSVAPFGFNPKFLRVVQRSRHVWRLTLEPLDSQLGTCFTNLTEEHQ